MSTNQPRRPAGTPDGGQWAPAPHAEADVELTKVIRTEGGQGGRRGHSNMEHWDYTEEVKRSAKKARRKMDRTLERRALSEADVKDAL